MHPLASSISIVLLLGAVTAQGYEPEIEPASKEGRVAIRKFKIPSDLEVELFAAEPMLANPVAFCFDTKGRIFVAETFRLHKGVTDNRKHKDWIDEELACRTVADRVRMYERKFAKEIDDWTSEHERVRMIEDTDGDGVADRSTVFADGFRELPDGIGAGLLAHEGRIWFTCIPKLWLLEDADDDGKADRRKALQDGYGVHTSLLGHDLHGLRIGPDGKLYFSIGDRGFHVVTPERTLSFPDEGAVLRCNLDGSELEVVHRGLRNPQELAFDRFGNLFTGDNNSDGGDKARWVYVVEGGHSGWHIGFQSIPDRGPWNREKLWHPHFRSQAAYIVPPIANLINGPSGLTHDPGTGLPARYRDHFFLCEFRGMSSISGIVALKVTPKGAGFELTDTEDFFWKVLPTDVEFGMDGALYALDWVTGWGQTAKGRIYRIAKPGIAQTALVRQTADLLRQGMKDRRDVVRLLGHADQRVRQAAQFELVRRASTRELVSATEDLDNRMARIHAIWGLGQLGCEDSRSRKAVLRLLTDSDHEIRAQAAKVLGQCKVKTAVKPLIACLDDRSSRVRFFAAISLGRIGDPSAAKPLVAMLEANDGRDAYLRHAGIQGLAGMPGRSALKEVRRHASREVRLGGVVMLRRQRNEAAWLFLDDPDPLVRLEAARAIHDEPLEGAMMRLAERLKSSDSGHAPFVRRAINANLRLGTDACVERLVSYALTESNPEKLRVEALDALRHWAEPSNRDRIVNLWRPPSPRNGKSAVARLRPHLESLLKDPSTSLNIAAIEFVADNEQTHALHTVHELCLNETKNPRIRLAALKVLRKFDAEGLEACARKAYESGTTTALRTLGLRILAAKQPKEAVPLLDDMIGGRVKVPWKERQGALATLAELEIDAARTLLARCMDRLLAGEFPTELQLDLLEAAKKSGTKALAAKVDRYHRLRTEKAGGDMVLAHAESLRGGDKNRGESVFFSREDATSCKRCHTVHGRGGDAGPDLTDVGTRLTREQILASLLDPGREIAKDYGTFVYTLEDGSVVAGIVQSETDDGIVLLDATEEIVVVDRKSIKEVSKPASSMPPMAGLLNRRELRDLVEYLKQPKKKRE